MDTLQLFMKALRDHTEILEKFGRYIIRAPSSLPECPRKPENFFFSEDSSCSYAPLFVPCYVPIIDIHIVMSSSVARAHPKKPSTWLLVAMILVRRRETVEINNSDKYIHVKHVPLLTEGAITKIITR
jgi:hypothetical protein